jgi:hypothetical protein
MVGRNQISGGNTPLDQRTDFMMMRRVEPSESLKGKLLTCEGVLLSCAAVVGTILVASPAAARIECRDNFQITKYGPISTPYCEEKQIARVARSYGIAVTDAEVRNNPNTKVYLCQRLGGDIRLKGSCGAYDAPPRFPW